MGGETHTLAGKGVGDPIPTKGQKLWYSLNTTIPLRSRGRGEMDKRGKRGFLRAQGNTKISASDKSDFI